jgi:Uma2 family endonuclease
VVTLSSRDLELLERLYRIDGKAEVIQGEIVRQPPFGCLPGIVCANVLVSLHAWCQTHGLGVALGSTVGYEGAIIDGHLRTFCPDVSFKRLPVDVDSMRFVPGAPDFAVEVRGEDDYTPSAEMEIIEKRSDYFEAGTEVVWDVDTVGREIRCYHRDRRAEPRIFKPGDEADAEPAVPGWRISVNEVFEL